MRVLTVFSSISDMQNLLNFQSVALGPDWAIAVSFTIVSSYPVLLRQLVALLHDPCQMVAQCNNSEWQLLKEQRGGVPKSIKSNTFFRDPWWLWGKQKTVLQILYFTFHLRRAYCLLKFSKLTTDSLFTIACLGFRGCRDTVRDETAEQVSFMLLSNIQANSKILCNETDLNLTL